MWRHFRLIPALQLIFRTEIEFTEESFEELNAAQRAAFRRDHGDPGGHIFRVVQFEPTTTRSEDGTRVVVELSIVTETERQNVLDAVALIYDTTRNLQTNCLSFTDRLDLLRANFSAWIT